VIIFSAIGRVAFALESVVLIRSFSTKDVTRLLSKAFLWEEFLPSFFPLS
jgi:hypothetical protein